MPKISIIIPVFNATEYIINCINSLLKQTLQDIEVILVDDHGEDNSIEKSKKHIKSQNKLDKFLFLETPKNSGPGEARNIGINAATGDYIMFVDSDDWIEENMCFELYRVAQKRKSDICYCYAWQNNVKKKKRLLKNPLITQGEFKIKDKRYFLVNYISYFTTFLYRKSFLIENKIYFPPVKSAEDSYFVACCILCAKHVAWVEKALYHYILHPNSLSTNACEKRYISKLTAFNELISFSKNNNSYHSFQNELDFIYIKKAYLMSCLDYLKHAQKPKNNVLNKIHNSLLKTAPNYKTNIYYRKSYKIRFLTYLLTKFPNFCVNILSKFLKTTQLNGI